MIGRVRTALVALIVGIVAVRWSVSQPVSAVTRRIAADPWAAFESAGDGWTYAGTLGGASVDGLREAPYAFFLWLTSETGLSAHAAETCWRVLVLVLAVVGAVRVTRGLRRRDDGPEPWWPWLGAVLFALGAVLVPTLVQSPTDGLAAAALPWVVAPLLVGGLGWRPALASAVWVGVAGVGGPAWALAALVAGAVAALPRSRADAVRSVRWMVLAGVASAWWIALLVWERRHVLDLAELTDLGLRASIAAAVGRPESSLLVLVGVAAGPAVVALGALCLRSPRLERRFVAVVLGLVVVVAAALGVTGGRPDTTGPLLGLLALCGLVAWSPLVDDLLDRIGAPRRALPGTVVGVLVSVTTLTGLAAAAAEPDPIPASESRLLDAVADWSDTAPPGRVLVLPPGADGLDAFGSALGDRPWVGRDAVPASGAAATSALDDLVSRLVRGDGGPGTTSALRRLGFSYALVRLGGPFADDRAHPTALMRAALSTVGARREAVLRGSDSDVLDAVVDRGVRSSVDQVEVWGLPDAGAGRVFAGEPLDAVGDAGTVSDLADAGVLGDRAIRLRSASDQPVAVLSDSARRRDIDQRVPVDPYGPALGADEPRTIVPSGAGPVVSASRLLDGAVSVSSSSSAADLDGDLRAVGSDALAAVDRNIFTAWQSRRGTSTGEWWEVRFDAPVSLAGTSIQLQQNVFSDRSVSEVRVTTDAGSASYDVAPEGALTLDDPGRTTRLRITVTDVEGEFGASHSVGIQEVTLPGLTVASRLDLVETPADSWLLGARLGNRLHCVPVVPRGADEGDRPGTACDDSLSVSGPDPNTLDRTLTTDVPTTVTGRVWLAGQAAAEAGALADRIARPSVVVTSRSVASRDLATRPQAAADGDPRTAWRASPNDESPELTLTWERRAELTAIRLVPPADGLGSRPTRVRVLDTEVDVAEDGTIPLPTVRTRGLTITVLEDSDAPTIDSATGNVLRMPLAVGEVELVGGPAVTYDADRVQRIECADGPTLSIGGRQHSASLEVTPAQIVSGATVRATVCGEVALPAGEVRVTMPGSFAWQPLGVLLTTADLGADAAPEPVATDVLTDEELRLDLGTAADVRTLVLALPAGTGWEASADGERLEAVTVDGWAQGWLVPAQSGAVTVRYSAGADVGPLVLGASAGWLLVLLASVVVGVRSRRTA